MTGPRIPRDFTPEPSMELKLHPELGALLRDAGLALLPVLIAFLTRLLTKGNR